jgi:hypothetical protein
LGSKAIIAERLTSLNFGGGGGGVLARGHIDLWVPIASRLGGHSYKLGLIRCSG